MGPVALNLGQSPSAQLVSGSGNWGEVYNPSSGVPGHLEEIYLLHF